MFTITRNQLTALASLAHSTSTDDTTPVLTGIHITGNTETSTLTAVATDRYKVAELVFKNVNIEHDFTALVPAKWLQTAAKTLKGKASEGGHNTHIKISDETISATNHDTTLESRLLAGNYPPVVRLFPENAPTSIDSFPGWSLKPEFITDLAKIIPPTATARDIKNAPLSFAPSDNMNDTGKPAAVIVTRHGFDGFRALLQPNLLLS